MKAMLWKEMRENFKWAILAMVGLGLAEIYGLYYYDPQNYNNRGITLCNPTFLMATAFGNAVVGLLLGLVQIIPEQRRDQWAALLHRPVSRAVIFRGKVVAGICLYLIATLPPFLFCLWLAATPGHFASPFVPDLMLPAVSDICVGLVYYFAALVVALQRGPWFGARTVALMTAVYVSSNMAGMQFFYVAVETAVIMGLILFTSAWGAMLSNGKFQDRPWLARLALMAAVFYGVCGLGGMAVLLYETEQGEARYIYTGSQYKLTMDGQPIVVTAHKDLTTTVTDLAGNAIHDDRYTNNRSYQNEIRFSELTYYIGDKHGFDPEEVWYNYRQSSDYVIEINQVGEYQNPIAWFVLCKPNYVVGVDRRSKAVAEFADTTGFKKIGSPVEPFTNQESHWYNEPCLVQEKNRVFLYNLMKETVVELPSADTRTIYGSDTYQFAAVGGRGYDQAYFVAREKGVQVYDSKATLLATFPYNPKVNLDRWGTVEIGMNNSADRFYLMYSPSVYLTFGERVGMPNYLDELDLKGNVLHSYTLPNLPMPKDEFSWVYFASDCLHTPAFWFWDLAYQKIGAACGSKRQAMLADRSFRTHWGDTKKTTKHVVLTSFFFAVIALVWARSAGMSRKTAALWAAFVLAFNLAGLFTFRLVAPWPVRVPCPKCGRKRPIEETTCPHCHAGWPKPGSNGTEIFDESGKTAIALAEKA